MNGILNSQRDSLLNFVWPAPIRTLFTSDISMIFHAFHCMNKMRKA